MKATELLEQLRELNFTISTDDGRLIVRGPKEGLPPALRQQLSERKNEIIELLKLSALPPPALSRRAPRDREPGLSFAQQRLWFLDQLEPGKPIYNIAGALRLQGPLDAGALQRSLDEIVRRHETLRTTFASTENGPVQVISPAPQFTLLRDEIRRTTGEEVEAEIHRLAAAEANQPFDLSRGPLFRATLIRIAADDHVLLLTIHHIVSDGWSMGVLYRELSALYRAFLKGEASPLAELPIQYADFALWQREWLKGAELERQLAYWKKQLAGIPPLLSLPADRPRPAIQSFRGRTQSALFGKDLVEALKALNRREGVTLFMTLLAALQTLLHRYTGQEDIVVGAAIANRNRTEIEGLIGFFVNALALRAGFSGDPTFKDLLASVRRTALEAYEHQDLPFEKLVEELNPHRTLSYTPVFQVMFVLQNTPDSAVTLDGLSVSRVRGASETAKFDLTWSAAETAEGLRVSLQYNTDMFEDATIARCLGHYETLLAAIVENPDRRVSELSLLRQQEREQLLLDWNRTATEYPRQACVHRLFEAQVERAPEAIALVCDERELTYAELNRRANRLAHHLLNDAGVRPGDLVGVCLGRSFDLIVALLGILKAGCAYVPLDPAYPEERLAFMLEDTRVAVLISEQSALDRLPQSGRRIVCLDRDGSRISRQSGADVTIENSAENLAYVIYTSGSTGKPKGVAVSHRAVVRLVVNTDYIEIGVGDVIAQASNISFDAATFEIWGALLNGARLALISTETLLAPGAMSKAIEQRGITTLFLTTALFNQMVQRIPRALGRLRHLLFGGEAADPARVRELLLKSPPERLLHVYGPTETTTFATWYPVREVAEKAANVPIGRPIANTEIYILDARLNPLPVGVAGELYIGGDGLARGYLHRPDLTEERFIANPFRPGGQARLYRTGDHARYLADGNIEFVGRLDDQVKIRGYRIEPGEIETVLREHPAVQEAVVLVQEGGIEDKFLAAYIVPVEQVTPANDDLRSHLRKKLPDYMIPQTFVQLDSLPLTANGKVDKAALLSSSHKESAGTRGYIEPRNPIEWVLAAIWGEVLNLKRISVHDDFFELGGHSLLAIRLIEQIREECQVELSVRELFDSPTIAGIATKIIHATNGSGKTQEQARRSRLVEIQRGRFPEPVFIVPGGLGGEPDLIKYVRLARSVGPEYSLTGLVARDSNGISSRHATVGELAAEYLAEIRSVQPNGPYFLLGECIGGIVAYEMACQLRRQNQEVALLALMDSTRPTFYRYLRFRCARIRSGYRRLYYGLINNYYAQRAVFHLKKIGQVSWREKLPYLMQKSAVGLSVLPKSFPKTGREPGRAPGAEESAYSKAEQERYFRTLRRHRPKPYDGKLTLIVNEELYDRRPSDEWADLVSGAIEVEKAPGTHDTYLHDNARETAKIFRRCLDRARERYGRVSSADAD